MKESQCWVTLSMYTTLQKNTNLHSKPILQLENTTIDHYCQSSRDEILFDLSRSLELKGNSAHFWLGFMWLFIFVYLDCCETCISNVFYVTELDIQCSNQCSKNVNVNLSVPVKWMKCLFLIPISHGGKTVTGLNR